MAVRVSETRRAATARAVGAVEARRFPLAVAGIVAVLLMVGLWNAATLSPDIGYDAVQHQEYARLLVEERRIPEKNVETRALYDNPPGFYAVAGVAGKAGGDSAILYLNALFAAGAALLVLLLARELWPGRPVLQLGALAFAAWFPLVAKAAGLYHPAALALVLAAAGMYLAGRMIARRDYRLRWAVPLALLLLAGVAVLPSSLWVFGAVTASLGIAFLAGHGPRRRSALAVGAMVAVAALAAAPWVARQRANDVPVLGQLPELEAPWRSRPAAFFVDLGMPEVLGRPYRPSFASVLLPTAYSDLWGDYFGNFVWNSSVDDEPQPPVAAELAVQNWIGTIPSLLAVGGLFALLALAVAGRGPPAPRALAVSLPLLALAGFVYYASNSVTADGDTIKGIYMVTALPGWALAFGFALDRLARGAVRRPLLIALGLIALANARFLVAGSPLGGLL